MAELSFTNEGSKYVCEFEVSSDFNLHLERDKGGFLFLYQRSSDGGSYDSVGDAKFAPHDSIIDYDCTALVYPKFIKVVSEVEPTYGAVISDGEVTEIKAQSKEIEVTANGTTVVEPDAGFAYLNKVSVKTNVAGSGEGGGGSASSFKYYSTANGIGTGHLTSAIMKIRLNEDTFITPTAAAALELGDDVYNKDCVIAFGVDVNQKLYMDGMWMTIDDMAKITKYFTEITEEEFYNLNA